MIKYTALCDFTACVDNKHKQFTKGEVYESKVELPDVESYINVGFVTKETVADKPSTNQPTKK